MVFFKNWLTGDACELLPTLDAEQTARYRRFRRLLEHNRTALALQADLEQIYYDNRPFMPQVVEGKSRQLLLEVDGMVHALSGMTGKEYEQLFVVLRTIERSVQLEWSGTRRSSDDTLVLPLAHIGLEQMGLVGAKAANLAHATRHLRLPTPEGFALTTTACQIFLRESGLAEQIDALLAELVDDDPARLEMASRAIGERILATPLPGQIDRVLEAATAMFPPDQLVAVRSSAIGEDGEISFAGQYSSVLNVAVPKVGDAYRQVIASLYSASALSYRMHHGLDDRETPMGVLVLAMVQPNASGVLTPPTQLVPAVTASRSVRLPVLATSWSAATPHLNRCSCCKRTPLTCWSPVSRLPLPSRFQDILPNSVDMPCDWKRIINVRSISSGR